MRRIYIQLAALLWLVLSIPAMASQCAVDPLLEYTRLGGDAADNKIYIDADTSVANYEKAEFAGSVHLNQGENHILAPKLIYLDGEAQASAEDGGIFASTTFVVRGKKGRYDLENKRIKFNQANYLMVGEQQIAVGSAKNVESDQKKRIDSLENVTWTTCARESPAWNLKAKKLTIDHNKDRGVARNLTFHIKGVPAFYLPYFSFPTTSARQSGFLIPSASSTDSRGLELAIPYYWNIAPDKDATITLRPITKRGIMTQAEYRFLTEKQYGVFAGTWLPNDSKSDYGSRWSASIDHRYQFNDRWHSELLYQRVSDEDYIEDFEDGFTLYDDWYLESYVSVIGNTDFGDVLLRVQDYQKVNSAIGNDDAPYSRLPQLSYSQSWNKNGFNFNLNGEAVRFYKEKTGAAMRLDSELGASYRFTETYGYLEPKLSIQATHYNLDKDFSTITTLNSTTRVLPTFSLDGTLIFEREINWGDSSWTQTIEPRLFYLYTPYKDQSDIPLFDTSESSRSWNWLFARNRFTGRDRIGDANQLTTAVTTRFYNNEDGQEKLRLSLGQIQYFDDRQVSLSGNTIATRSSSVLVGEGAYQIDRHWDVYALAFWDADTHHNERDIVNLRYRLDADRYVNLSHSYSRDSYDQFTLSGGWRINPQWRAFARQDYSALYKQPFNTLLGVEYDDCCWAWRLVGKHYRESPDSKESHNAVYLEFVLKGLGNMGSRSGSILSEEIQGFSPLKEERRF